MRRIIMAVVALALVSGDAQAGARGDLLASCSELARGTSLTWDDPGEECSDFFLLETHRTVVVRLEPGAFVGTLGAALVAHETTVATFKRTFAGGAALDGPAEMTVDLGPGIWRMRAFAGVTVRCVGVAQSCAQVPGGAAGFYTVTVRSA